MNAAWDDPVLLAAALAAGVLVVWLLVWLGSRRRRAEEYQLRDWLFSPSERAFHTVLHDSVANHYRIFGKVRVADVITIEFGAACEAASHAVAYGELDRASLASYAWSGRACDVGPAGPYAWDQAGTPESTFFVLVGTSATAEGSYGLDGNGGERPEDETTDATCQQPQELLFRCD